MITYEYKCESCEKEFEELRKISELTSWTVCPKCKGDALRHFRTPNNIDTYFEGSTKWNYPVHGI